MTLFDTQRRSIRISRFRLGYSWNRRLDLTTKCDFHSFNGTGIICLAIRAKTSALNVNPMRSTTHTWTPFWKIFLKKVNKQLISRKKNVNKQLISREKKYVNKPALPFPYGDKLWQNICHLASSYLSWWETFRTCKNEVKKNFIKNHHRSSWCFCITARVREF